MNDPLYNPDTLAEHLDKVLPPGSHHNTVTGEDDPLVQAANHLASMPVPTLSADAIARIKAKLPAPEPMPMPARWRGLPTSIAAAAAVIVLVAIVVLSVNRDGTSVEEQSTLVAVVTAELEPTATATAIEPTPTATVATVEPTGTIMPTIPSATFTLEAVVIETAVAVIVEPTPEEDVNIVIEGEIEEIREEVIVIHGIDISVDPDDPLVKELRKGDYVRIEGTMTSVGVTVVIETVDLEIVDESVEVSEAGQVWRDDGNCNNPPPSWATATGWRRRCQPSNNPPAENPGRGNNNNRDRSS